jgi:hypothetical protein
MEVTIGIDKFNNNIKFNKGLSYLRRDQKSLVELVRSLASSLLASSPLGGVLELAILARSFAPSSALRAFLSLRFSGSLSLLTPTLSGRAFKFAVLALSFRSFSSYRS